MVPNPARASHLATLVLMAVAYITCEVAAYPDGRPRFFGIIFGIGTFTVAVALAIVLRPTAPDAKPSRRLSLALGALLVLPLVGEPLLRQLSDQGFPLELQLVNGLRIFGLLLAGLGAWTQFRRLAGVVALFLALFASAMGDQDAIPYLLVAFAHVGGFWLVLEHRSADGSAATVMGSELTGRVALKMPYRELIVFGVLAAGAGAVALAGPKRVQFALGELLPTSGGTGETDPFARYGIGDGPEETAGDNAKAAGMVESDTMIEDTKDALIDAVSDMYGPPHKPRKEQERMVAVGKVDVIENHEKLPDNRRPSRDFDTGRKGPKTDKLPDGQKARGIIEIEGRTPLHIRVVAYETYDAESMRWQEGRRPGNRLFEPDGGDWMQVTNFRDANWYSADDRHRFKIADLKDNLVPTPPLLTRFRIHRVDRPEYYEWDFDGVLALAGRKKTPPGLVIATDCRTLDYNRLGEAAFHSREAMPGPVELRDVPASLKPELERIATEWAGHEPRGWPQISAILAKLRTEYVLDSKAVAPAGHPAPPLWFLTESRRGPDYLFASSATLLIRSLGYPSRICLGYYASPAAYDSETDHTPVTKTDLHFWPEVLLKDGHWLVVEPTPGYETLPPLQPWSEWIDGRLAAMLAFASRNALALTALVLASLAFVRKRRRLFDLFWTLSWKLRPGRTWQQIVLNSALVLDRRGSLAGRPRVASQSLADWLRAMTADDAKMKSLVEFVRLAEWAAYAPQLPPPLQEHDVHTVCRRTIREWSFRTFVEAERGVTA